MRDQRRDDRLVLFGTATCSHGRQSNLITDVDQAFCRPNNDAGGCARPLQQGCQAYLTTFGCDYYRHSFSRVLIYDYHLVAFGING
ncbi:hypothetical protein RPD_3268 [Rhodopseudomonas palustris BisB5]|uniref:Uncharacterized protein n=1 Tax=Rhodopseudomonas palustris (strain BisB5) TaxID=316057 RepID=Q134J7_RHOPS|nr:hypothetical protein RPD_3268 [Rhodopseudomonas palustris BisB5]